MPPTKASNPNEQIKLEKAKFRLKEKKQSEENSLKENQLLKIGEKPGQTKLFR